MGYRIKLDDEEAAVAYAGLPANLRRHLSAELRRLAANPSALSVPAHFPYPQDGQLFHLKPIITEDAEHFFTVMFKYGGEEFLLVQWISHQRRSLH